MQTLVYLDHNIIDAFVKGRYSDLEKLLCKSFQIVYSDENLKEISRSPEHAGKYIYKLKELKAYYMEVSLDDKWRILDNARYFNSEPEEVYKAHLKNKNENMADIDLFQHKLLGGQQGLSFDSVLDEQQEQLDAMLKPFEDDGNILAPFISHLRVLGQETHDNLKNTLKSAITNSEEFDGTGKLREHTGTNPNLLNNLKGPGIIYKIWQKVKNIPGMPPKFESFVGLDNPDIWKLVNPNNTYYQKVCAIYVSLQMLGYWSDRRNKNNKEYRAFLSDQYHVANAIFSKAIITMDKHLAMKAGATYDYLGIATKIILLNR